MGSNIDIMTKYIIGFEQFTDPKFYEKVLKDLDRELVAYQRGQMDKGLNNEGKEIGFLRSVIYAADKKKKGGKAPFGVVDLENTGSFKDALEARIKSNLLEFTSTDSKTTKLKKKYDNIFGLSNQTREEFVEDILFPVMMNKLDESFN